MNATKGVIYIATGREFIRDACRSASSLKNANPNISVSLFASEAVHDRLFDQIFVLTNTSFSYIDKVTNMYSSPYDYTLFLDVDTHVCDNISDLFKLLESFDIAIAHASNRISRGARYLIQDVPESFVELNTGVILFKKSRSVENLFVCWREFYLSDIEYYSESSLSNNDEPNWKLRFPHDQPAFREALYKSKLRIATLPPEYNCRFNFPFFVSGTVKILHGRYADLQMVARIVNRTMKRRVFETVGLQHDKTTEP